MSALTKSYEQRGSVITNRHPIWSINSLWLTPKWMTSPNPLIRVHLWISNAWKPRSWIGEANGRINMVRGLDKNTMEFSSYAKRPSRMCPQWYSFRWATERTGPKVRHGSICRSTIPWHFVVCNLALYLESEIMDFPDCRDLCIMDLARPIQSNPTWQRFQDLRLDLTAKCNTILVLISQWKVQMFKSTYTLIDVSAEAFEWHWPILFRYFTYSYTPPAAIFNNWLSINPAKPKQSYLILHILIVLSSNWHSQNRN